VTGGEGKRSQRSWGGGVGGGAVGGGEGVVEEERGSRFEADIAGREGRERRGNRGGGGWGEGEKVREEVWGREEEERGGGRGVNGERSQNNSRDKPKRTQAVYLHNGSKKEKRKQGEEGSLYWFRTHLDELSRNKVRRGDYMAANVGGGRQNDR